jgi:hypothetical protein
MFAKYLANKALRAARYAPTRGEYELARVAFEPVVVWRRDEEVEPALSA